MVAICLEPRVLIMCLLPSVLLPVMEDDNSILVRSSSFVLIVNK